MALYRLLLLSIITFTSIACGGGGGGDEFSNTSLDNNSCDLLTSARSKNVNRIISGTNCSTSAGPIVRVLLLNNDQRSVNICTGSLITQKKVLTAAHCFLNAVSAVITINNQPVQGVVVNSHPLYLSSEFPDNAFDIAVLELERPVNQPTLPILVGRDLDKGEVAGIFGYGQTIIAEAENGNESSSLQSGEVIIREVGNLFYRSEFTNRESNACFGDSGGPLAVQHLGRTAIAGTTSFGTNLTCGEGDRGAYNRLQESLTLDFLNIVAADAEYL